MNKDINIKDFHNFCKDIRMNFNDDFSNIVISLFIDIENKNRFSNDFNNFCKDKNEDFNNKFCDKSISAFVSEYKL